MSNRNIDENNWNKQVIRILAILGINKEKDAGVYENTLAKYMDYLKSDIEFPCQVTGIEDFEWEEFYVLGPGDKREYEKLKKTKPSYTDKYEILNFFSEPDDFYGIIVRVKRLSDKKKFELPLADLKTVKKESPNIQLLHDYSVWFVNYR